MGIRPVTGGGKRVEVAPERLAAWLVGFEARHGTTFVAATDGRLVLTAADGQTATCEPPPGASPETTLDGFVGAATVPRCIGLLLVRRGGIAVGLANGGTLEWSKVDGAYVQARTAAGGWSQQRFARRRENQTRSLVGRAAQLAVRLLSPAGLLEALVTGGDRRLTEAVLADPLLPDLPAPARHVDVPDPRLTVLRAAVAAARAVHIVLREAPVATMADVPGARYARW